MPKMMAPVLPILSIFGFWAVVLGTVGGPGKPIHTYRYHVGVHLRHMILWLQ